MMITHYHEKGLFPLGISTPQSAKLTLLYSFLLLSAAPSKGINVSAFGLPESCSFDTKQKRHLTFNYLLLIIFPLEKDSS